MLLEAKGLSVECDGQAILRGVDLAVDGGEVVGVLGPSGAGKTTLFRALTGELVATAGSVRLGALEVTGWPLWQRAREGLGYIPQSPSVLWDLTVRQNLTTFQRVATGRVSDLLGAAQRVSLDGRLDVRAGDLSAGERRRLEFARAITRSPRVLICDEPFAGVDPVGAGRLAALLKQLAEGGVAVVLADHHVAEALGICSRALLLLDGAVAVTETPEAFRSHPLVQGRYLGTWSS